ncbi:hypothetical protein BB558_000356 [Smittium angustum]|uniref:rRNA-processing protein n=1 Tax=Smittium angustum TaxID=133377 RepID=A0A2U1JEN5_SMIAN|nr:hypothetical protein BB558_000356 [Smittium angustum]
MKENKSILESKDIANPAGIETRVSGRVWKSAKKATNRTTLPKILKQTWDKKEKERREKEAATKLHREMKQQYDEKRQAEKDHIRERRKMREEKERLDALQATLSARKKLKLKKKELKAKARAKH